ncbi:MULTISPECIES: hypothetical protein [unclassified Caulobacter]|uniref:hypothetical protein n=1 Tax=unclassified Caulobacter TaxID=2648921 RepID=UPI0006F70582|nr:MULTISPECIES: hypothetical protein [unclassified Caulobacter]KQV58719.1 hypothetical protein ASC62_08075 [Caulobacter sp. Root342]KQV68772.1 hypothetical protein ASC70_07960 [Caulobacter sp. Root343]
MGELAPIAIFSFRRPHHLAATLDALQQCPEFAASEVIAYSDGPRRASDEAGVNEVRQLLRSRKTPNMTLVERPINMGLANSIIGAVTEITRRAGKVIVVEDDLVLQPSALAWLNAGLNAYVDDERVMQISAYQYRVPEFAQRQNGTFQRFATTWGWGTWERAWKKFDAEANGWRDLIDNPEIRTAFDAGGVYPFADMLQKQMSGRIDSWGIRWSWSVFRNQGLTLMPPRSLVRNTGLDGSGTHSTLGPLKRFVAAPQPLQWHNAEPPQLPTEVILRAEEEQAFRRALKNTHALRNHHIKRALAKAGLKHFADA